jgi:hypothetical protein
VKTIKYWYYGTLFLVCEFVFRVTLSWSNDWERVLDAHETTVKFLLKAEENRP